MDNSSIHPERPKNNLQTALNQVMTLADPKLAQVIRDYMAAELNPPSADDQPQNKKTRWTIGELAAADFPAPKWAVPGIIPVGLTFLAGRPKLGKSWLALQVAEFISRQRPGFIPCPGRFTPPAERANRKTERARKCGNRIFN
jgi:hypothetical protein